MQRQHLPHVSVLLGPVHRVAPKTTSPEWSQPVGPQDKRFCPPASASGTPGVRDKQGCRPESLASPSSGITTHTSRILEEIRALFWKRLFLFAK